MDITLSLDQEPRSTELMERIRRNFSDDSNPFAMSELHIFNAFTRSPLTSQTIKPFLFSFLQSLPILRYQTHLNQSLFVDKSFALNSLFGLEPRPHFETQLEKWLPAYADQVRSPLRGGEFPTFLQKLYSVLGPVRFFARTYSNVFETPHYFCLNYNALIITQNKNLQTTNKVALFSFFASD